MGHQERPTVSLQQVEFRCRHGQRIGVLDAGAGHTHDVVFDAEAASQLTQLTLFCLLAAVMWFVAVEQPKLEQVPGLLATVKEMKKQARDLKEELAATNRELERVEKASPAGMQASSMKVFQQFENHYH